MTKKKEAVKPPKESDPSEGVITHEAAPFIEVRVNTTWAASYIDGQIASAIRLFHRPEFIADLMVNSTHEALKAVDKAVQGAILTAARKGVLEAVERAKARAAEADIKPAKTEPAKAGKASKGKGGKVTKKPVKKPDTDEGVNVFGD